MEPTDLNNPTDDASTDDASDDAPGGRGNFESDSARHAALLLHLVPGVGPRLREALLQRFGTAEAIFTASSAQLRAVGGIGDKLSGELTLASKTIDVDAELERCRQAGVDLIPLESSSYPSPLREISDPPGMLFVRGEFMPEDALAIGIVGSRHATKYGRDQTERLASGLARAGITIVSGLARGIDAVAHRAALTAGGRTIAVLASGVSRVYPPEHEDLASKITVNGVVVSEAPSHAVPSPGAFPRRNRIISGLSLGIIVIEASDRSGALITARHAGEQGRDVFALPGRVDSRMSRGCHQLLRDGAVLIRDVDDVLESLGPLADSVRDSLGDRQISQPAELQLNEHEQRVLQAIGREPTTIDVVIAGAGLPTSQILSTLSILEMRRLIRRLEGSRVVRC